mmetsp:Transcript_20586/g.54016  ORF Transcript_20586/g.54016 Transcript_20586/m.54016 type:complete len:85 (+) Transcript_20586:566-820(+)
MTQTMTPQARFLWSLPTVSADCIFANTARLAQKQPNNISDNSNVLESFALSPVHQLANFWAKKVGSGKHERTIRFTDIGIRDTL